MRINVRIAIRGVMLATSGAIGVWSRSVERSGNDALALAERDAPVEMIVGGAIALPSTTAEALHECRKYRRPEATR